jgi:hypothetical protein
MYTSDLFKKSLTYAKQLNPRKIYILSAKYGVLELDDLIDPYEKTLNEMKEPEKKKWAFMCLEQLKDKGTDFDEETTFLCGINYRKHLINEFRNPNVPLMGLGIGQQLSFYKKHIEERNDNFS